MKKVPDVKRRIFFCQVQHFAKKIPNVKYKEMGIEEIEKIKKVLEEKNDLEVQKAIVYEKM